MTLCRLLSATARAKAITNLCSADFRQVVRIKLGPVEASTERRGTAVGHDAVMLLTMTGPRVRKALSKCQEPLRPRQPEHATVAFHFGGNSESLGEIVGKFHRWTAVRIVQLAN